MADEKPLSDYKQKLLEEEQKEYSYGIIHGSIEEAMVTRNCRDRMSVE